MVQKSTCFQHSSISYVRGHIRKLVPPHCGLIMCPRTYSDLFLDAVADIFALRTSVITVAPISRGVAYNRILNACTETLLLQELNDNSRTHAAIWQEVYKHMLIIVRRPQRQDAPQNVPVARCSDWVCGARCPVVAGPNYPETCVP